MYWVWIIIVALIVAGSILGAIFGTGSSNYPTVTISYNQDWIFSFYNPTVRYIDSTLSFTQGILRYSQNLSLPPLSTTYFNLYRHTNFGYNTPTQLDFRYDYREQIYNFNTPVFDYILSNLDPINQDAYLALQKGQLLKVSEEEYTNMKSFSSVKGAEDSWLLEPTSRGMPANAIFYDYLRYSIAAQNLMFGFAFKAFRANQGTFQIAYIPEGESILTSNQPFINLTLPNQLETDQTYYYVLKGADQFVSVDSFPVFWPENPIPIGLNPIEIAGYYLSLSEVNYAYTGQDTVFEVAPGSQHIPLFQFLTSDSIKWVVQ